MFALSGNMYNPLQDATLNITELDNYSFEIYPNPTSDYLFVNFRASRPKTISLYSINGMELLRKQINTPEIRLDIKHLKSGVYLLNIDEDNFKVVKF